MEALQVVDENDGNICVREIISIAKIAISQNKI
jgi:hypothetical protein